VVGQKRAATEASPPLWDFGLMVQAVQAEKPGTEEQKTELTKEQKTERLDVLEGLRKYAKDHLLLIGKPGSGKSTALVRLLLEEAQKAQQETQAIIPVLVELRYYQTSVIDLIRDFLKRHEVLIQSSEIETLLFEGKLLLLIDGVNELPSEEARRNLKAFEQNHPATPMAFTTRELLVEGNLSIVKKLEMQALTETQMREFVENYLPGKGEQLLRQLGARLREFGQTPLLLWMLCSVFSNSGSVPPNLGLVFRSFSESYEKIQEDAPAKDESRQWWHRLLCHLAFTMMQGKERTELQVAIPKEEAETTLIEFLQKYHQPHNAFSWLNDLVKYHLIQIANDQIEFRHQLIQEYYAAEQLLKLLPELSDESLKRDYLNYLKWTEPLALMLTLLEDEAQALRVVKLGLEVDWQLGARLAGEVKLDFQEETVGLISELDISQKIKNQLLSKTRSASAVLYLFHALDSADANVCKSAVQVLGEFAVDIQVLTKLLDLLDNNNNSEIRSSVVIALGQIGSSMAIPKLFNIFLNLEETKDIRLNSAIAIGQIGCENVSPDLIPLLFNDDLEDWLWASDIIGQVANQTTIDYLIQILEKSNDEDLVGRAIYPLGKIRNKSAIPSIIKIFENQNSSHFNRSQALKALGEIGDISALPTLVSALKDSDNLIRANAAIALGKLGNTRVIPNLLDALQDSYYQVKQEAVLALGKIGDDSVVSALIPFLEHEASEITEAEDQNEQGHLSEWEVQLKLLECEKQKLQKQMADAHRGMVQRAVLVALGQIGSKAAVSSLLQFLKENGANTFVIHALGRTGSLSATPYLVHPLGNEDPTIRASAAFALARVGDITVVPELLKILNDSDINVIKNILYALGELGNYEILQLLSNFLLESSVDDIIRDVMDAISTIQFRQKFYNQSLILQISILGSMMHILHLSDLHFGTPDQANRWAGQLAEDLRQELGISHLDALILSGDIANKSTPEEYAAAKLFLDEFRQDFPLNPDQIVIVPGNHDLNWELSKKAYKLTDIQEEDQPQEDYYIKESETVIRLRDEEQYKQRFTYFNNFYEAIKGEPYPLEYDQQGILHHIPEQNLLILGLNSAWQVDHHYKSRASIHMGALSNSLTKIRRDSGTYESCLKIAVWHHPLDSAFEDRITDRGFMERLAVNGFRLFLHGHIHKAETSLYPYDMSPNGRKLDGICAGTFGAHTRELMPGYPWQYNLLKFYDNQLIVKTRRREEPNGAWKPDARWLQGAGEQNPLPYYKIQLFESTQVVKIQQSGQKTPKDSFLTLLKWISEKSCSLEKLQPAHGKEVLELIRKARQSRGPSIDFTEFEIKTLDLVFNYCHYFSQGGKARSSELEKLKKAEDYYFSLKQMVASKEKIRVGSVKLSSLVGDPKMSKIVEQLEENNEF